MRRTSSLILAVSILGSGFVGLGLLALVWPDTGSGTPPATLADQLENDSAPIGIPSPERVTEDVPQRIPLSDDLEAALASAVEKDSYAIERSTEYGEYQALSRAHGMGINRASRPMASPSDHTAPPCLPGRWE